MKNFKDWCHSIGMNETRVAPRDMVGMEVLKECWDYQQQRLELTEKALKIAIEGMEAEINRSGGTVPILVESLKQIKEVLKE